MGAITRGRARPVLAGRPHRRPAQHVLGDQRCCSPMRVPALRHRRHVRRRHRRRRVRRRGAARARRARVRRDAGQPAARPRRPRRPSAPSRARSRSSTRRSPPPLVQRPLDHGVDLVVHSATKGIAGHNDAMLGVVAGATRAASTRCGATTSSTARRRRRSTRGTACAASAPLPCGCASRPRPRSGWPSARGPPRGRRACAIPGLDSHPQRDLAKRQMTLGRHDAHVRARRRARGGPPVRRVGARSPSSRRRSAGPRRSSPTRRR